MTYTEEYIREAHKQITSNESEIRGSKFCVCLSCSSTFSPNEITEWIPDVNGNTAMCPNCHTDTVIGSASGYPIDKKDFIDAVIETCSQ